MTLFLFSFGARKEPLLLDLDRSDLVDVVGGLTNSLLPHLVFFFFCLSTELILNFVF